MQVRVTVQPAESERLHPIFFTLTRWMLDPSLAVNETSTGSMEGQTEPSGSTDDTSN
jgi:hypothetical protein